MRQQIFSRLLFVSQADYSVNAILFSSLSDMINGWLCFFYADVYTLCSSVMQIFIHSVQVLCRCLYTLFKCYADVYTLCSSVIQLTYKPNLLWKILNETNLICRSFLLSVYTKIETIDHLLFVYTLWVGVLSIRVVYTL